jgi:hypothetical protein
VVLGAIALTSSGFLIGSSPDEEEFRFAIVSSWLHAQSLLHGDYGFWTPLLGLGIPQPLTPNFWLHPLVPLLPLLGPVMWVRLLLLAHTLLGASGMWQLTKTLGLTPLTRSVCVATFVLAAPVCNYVFTDFWPSHYVVWTSMPWVLVLWWRILDGDSRKALLRSLALGLSAGLIVASTNPGHILVYITLLLAVALTNAGRLAARWPWIAMSALIAVLIASPNIAQLVHERRMFDPNLGVDAVGNPLTWSDLRTVFLGPWALTESSPGRVAPAVARTLFFGGPFAALGIVGCVLFARRRLDLVVTIVMAAFMLFTSVVWLPFASARFHFRDPLTLAAIPLAGLAADRLLLSRWRTPAVSLLVLQVTVVAMTAWPFLRGTWGDDARAAMWLRGASGAREHVDRLLALMPDGGRIVYSPSIEHEVYEKGRLQEGLGMNALAFRGVPVLNGWFKGVSTARIWPDERMYYARINPPQSLIESDAALDALHIRYVLASDDETVAPSLRRRGIVPKRDRGMFVVFENTDAWPEAFVLDADSERLELPVRNDCGNDRLLCRDFTPLASHRVADVAAVTVQDGRIDVELVDANEPKLLVVSQMFRPDWVVTGADEGVSTLPAFGGLLAVHLPPHVTAIHLRYRPIELIVTTIAAWVALLGCGIALLVATSRSRFRVPASKFP